MKIYYGMIDHLIDVTNICLDKLTHESIISIPCGDANRANHFTDPCYKQLKKIFIEHPERQFHEYDHEYNIKINIQDNTISTIHENDIVKKLNSIHSTLQIHYGGFHEELPEQKMATRYLTGKEKVLEIGGNIGRNSLIIASLLEDDRNLVTLECDVNIGKQLVENRDLNGLHFHVEPSALSMRKLVQRGWDTMPSETLPDGYHWISTMNVEQLNSKYQIPFDTLVLDCEGAFYYILMDMPEILNNINLILMENDYYNFEHKKKVDEILIKHHFYLDYREKGGWEPCYNCFFEVWKR